MDLLKLFIIAFLCAFVGFLTTAFAFALISHNLIPCIIAYVVGCALMHKFINKMDES